MIISLKKPQINSISDARDIRRYNGQRRQGFEILLAGYEVKQKTDPKRIWALGPEATRRVRELREGWTTEPLRARGMMLWVDPCEMHDGWYWMYPVTWERWVKLTQELGLSLLSETARHNRRAA